MVEIWTSVCARLSIEAFPTFSHAYFGRDCFILMKLLDKYLLENNIA